MIVDFVAIMLVPSYEDVQAGGDILGQKVYAKLADLYPRALLLA